jgi:hypothetical protein
MGSRFLDRLILRCTHEFSWPRTSADGTYYQACFTCGAQYAYGWENMRRTGRIQAVPANSDGTTPARRMRIGLEVQYKERGSGQWQHGVTADINQTGVKITGPAAVKENAAVEMVFEMPEQIAGSRGRKVACSGRVVRVVNESAKESAPGFAATLSDYRYLPCSRELEPEETQAS